MCLKLANITLKLTNIFNVTYCHLIKEETHTISCESLYFIATYRLMYLVNVRILDYVQQINAAYRRNY